MRFMIKQQGGVIAEPGVGVTMFLARSLPSGLRSGTYEEVSLGASDTVSEAKVSIGSYLGFYHGGRPYSRRDPRPPDQASFNRPRGGVTGRRASWRWPAKKAARRLWT